MIIFGGITHVIRTAAGRYALVGAVPRSLCDEHAPTRADVLAGRVDRRTHLVYRPRVYRSACEAFMAIDAAGTGCQLATCACAELRRDRSCSGC